MAVVPPERFEDLLEPLDEQALAAFVADVWDARGWRTQVDGVVVTAMDGPRGGEERIWCVPRRRWPRPERPPGTAVDVVVLAREPRRFRSVPAGLDARILGPQDLRSMVLYGIDRETADRLVASHLGRRRPWRAAWRRTVPARARLLVGVLVLVAVLAGLTATSSPGWPLADTTTPLTTEPHESMLATVADPAASDGPRDGPATEAVYRYPPGIGPEGVTDPDRLATTHREALTDYPYTLSLVHYRTTDLLHPDRQWVAAWHTVDRVDATRYRLQVTGVVESATGIHTTVAYDEFADRSYRYRRTAQRGGPEYQRTAIPEDGEERVFAALAGEYLSLYLSTTESRVEVIEDPFRTWFRLVATGTPTRLSGPVANYTAVAVVDGRGQVHRLTVTYRTPEGSPTAAGRGTTAEAAREGTVVRFELSYQGVGATTITPPPWYEEARNATAGRDHE